MRDPIREAYGKIYSKLGASPEGILLFTMAVLVASELPIYFFTLLDILRLPALYKYRLHYARSVSEHLGGREYPPLKVIRRTLEVSQRNFLGAYLFPGTLSILISNYLGIKPYETDPEKLSWKRAIVETAGVVISADLLFYLLHRLMHTKLFYIPMHKMHHEFRYSIALAHHWMTFREALLFAFPQALPPLVAFLLGRRVHIFSMWAAFFFTQLNAILGHAGWSFGLPPSFGFLQASYHDFHHVDHRVNYGAIFPLTDMIFGTYRKGRVGSGIDMRCRREMAYP